jgi:hypothetical protein
MIGAAGIGAVAFRRRGGVYLASNFRIKEDLNKRLWECRRLIGGRRVGSGDGPDRDGRAVPILGKSPSFVPSHVIYSTRAMTTLAIRPRAASRAA